MSHQRMVYVVDHDMEVRRTLARHLAAAGAEAWPFSSGSEFFEIIDHLAPGCILLDMDVPGMPGLELMEELARLELGWPVVAMSAREEVALAVEAMKRGAVDFLQKPVGEAALRAALLPAWLNLGRTVEAQEARRAAQERIARLTAREVDVSLALLCGQANKTVAHSFGISVRTVEMHRAHIMAKLGVKSLAEAALIATQAGLALTAPALVPRPDPAPPAAAAERVGDPFAARRLATGSAV